MNEVFVTVAHRHGEDVAGNLGGEGEFAGRSEGAVFSHEEAAAASDATDGAKETAAAGHLGVGGHLNRGAHPGKLAGFGDNGLVGLEDELEHRHGGSDNIALHL